MRHPEVLRIARQHGVHAEQVIFRFAMQAGMVPLTGTSSLQHMKEDLRVHDFSLTPEEVEFIESVEIH